MCLNSFKCFSKYLERPEATGSVLQVCRAVFLSPEGLLVPVSVERGKEFPVRAGNGGRAIPRPLSGAGQPQGSTQPPGELSPLADAEPLGGKRPPMLL